MAKPPKHYQKLAQQFPAFLEAVEQLGQVSRQSGPIDEKNAQLLQLAASAAIRSEGGVHSHTKRALKAGVSPEEIRHSLILLTSTLGFPTVMAALSWSNDILED